MTLKRVKQAMPDWVEQTLLENDVMQDYLSRPDYQRNDYLGWIHRAKTEPTRLKRLAQMIEELKSGGVYMKMKHPASLKNNE